MASLNWIGKEAVVNHDNDVPFKLLKKVKTASIDDKSENLVIHGDNLEALKALMPHYTGKIKCIYIDPPYNTGNESWVYNDKVNSPKIKQWLGKVVGKESEDLTRHDKWLCMMYPRMKLLRDLLADDGVIFISIDDNEIHHLKIIMNEIFGENNFIMQAIRKSKTANNKSVDGTNTQHEYLLTYAKCKGNVFLNGERKTFELYTNPDNDKNGDWISDNPTANLDGRKKKNVFSIINPYTKQKDTPPKGRHWNFSETDIKKFIKNGKIIFKKEKNGSQRGFILKRYKKDIKSPYHTFDSLYFADNGYTNSVATRDIYELFGFKAFEYTKPVEYIRKIIQSITRDGEGIVLDSFAGSGTTGHAVLDLNKEDGGNRKFILVEMEDKVAKDITAERVKGAIKKYKYKDGFEYCELGKPLFNEDGQIDNSCGFKELATYIYFTETQTNIDTKKISGNFIGDEVETEYYLIYKGRNRNDLDKSFLKNLKKTSDAKVIYADRCFLDDKVLEKHGIEFKQIPYEVKVY